MFLMEGDLCGDPPINFVALGWPKRLLFQSQLNPDLLSQSTWACPIREVHFAHFISYDNFKPKSGFQRKINKND